MSINDLPFPKHNDQGNSHVMIALYAKMEVEGDKAQELEGYPNFDMAQHDFFKCENFCDQMDFSAIRA